MVKKLKLKLFLKFKKKWVEWIFQKIKFTQLMDEPERWDDNFLKNASKPINSSGRNRYGTGRMNENVRRPFWIRQGQRSESASFYYKKKKLKKIHRKKKFGAGTADERREETPGLSGSVQLWLAIRSTLFQLMTSPSGHSNESQRNSFELLWFLWTTSPPGGTCGTQVPPGGLDANRLEMCFKDDLTQVPPVGLGCLKSPRWDLSDETVRNTYVTSENINQP